MTTFDKPAHTIDQQLELLCQRGLVIPDEGRARHYLANISYYRLSAYTRPFYVPREQTHRFLPGTTFDQVLALYIFDRELRILLLDAIERSVTQPAKVSAVLRQAHSRHSRVLLSGIQLPSRQQLPSFRAMTVPRIAA